MQKKAIIALALTVTLLSVAIGQAFAVNLSGQITYNTSGLSGAKATAERVGEYEFDFTDSSGNYAVVVDTINSYTVSGSKALYTYKTAIYNGGNSSANVNVAPTRTLTDIKFKVAYDTDTGVTLSQAKSQLLSAEPWFKTEHSIDFVETTASSAWTSSDAVDDDICVLNNEMRDDANWFSGSYGSAEILIGFTDGAATGGTGCANTIPNTGGTHPYVIADLTSPDIARTVMHEISHAYGFSHVSSCTSLIPGIMASVCGGSDYVKNWVPADDTTLESRRSWY